jgi:hypothetical protein
LTDAVGWTHTAPLATCVWRIETETSTYIYDVDSALLTRLPGGAGSLDGQPLGRYELRRDHDPIPVLFAAAPIVGQPWEIVLALRADDAPTFRRTTWICHITRLAEAVDP